MEKRIVLAFALSFLAFVFYIRFFAPVSTPESEAPSEAPSSTGATSQEESRTSPLPAETKRVGQFDEIAPIGETTVPPASSGAVEAATDTEPLAQTKASRERQVVVETPLYQATLSNRGAVIRSFLLKQHQNTDGDPMEMVRDDVTGLVHIAPLALLLPDRDDTGRVREALFETATTGLSLEEGDEQTVEFLWADGGLEVRKTLHFDGTSYVIRVDVSVSKNGAPVAKQVLFGPGVGQMRTASRYRGVDKGIVVSRGEIGLFTASKIEEGEGGALDVSAAGVSSHYFAALMLAEPGAVSGARLFQDRVTLPGVGDKAPAEQQVITAGLELPREATHLTLFIGPKKVEILESLQPGLGGIIEFGSWMRFVALPLRTALMTIYGFVGNYGWSIILLTLFINVLLIPLKHHSYVSMRRMQKLAPQVKRIQERYKKVKPTDPRRQEMNKEIMGLYQEHNVSPLSGCLPMVLMIPFFFAFYRVLMASIELRHAPFVLWIQDLSVEDPFFVLPILMGVSQLGMQRMTPQTSADPMQARIMSFMPIFFTFILAWAPSGLVLYWFSNNLVSMGQQQLTNRFLKGKEESQEAAAEIQGKKRKSKKQKKPG